MNTLVREVIGQEFGVRMSEFDVGQMIKRPML